MQRTFLTTIFGYTFYSDGTANLFSNPGTPAKSSIPNIPEKTWSSFTMRDLIRVYLEKDYEALKQYQPYY